MKTTGRDCDYCGLPFTGSGYSPDGERHYCCYGCHLVSEIVHARQDEGIAAWVLLRLGIGAFLAMNVMMLSLVLYTTPAAEIGLPAVHGLHWVLLALSTPILVILGGPFLSGSLRDLKHARVGMDVLIFTGSVSAYLVSARSTILGQGHVYFDTSAMLLLIVTLGKFLEVSVKSHTGAAVRDALELIPATARVVREGMETEVASGEIRAGDRIIVRPGESIPADGWVVSGECSITEAAFTGEPGPRVCSPGDTVYGGSIDHDGLITVEATAAGGASLLAQVQEMARRAQMERAPIERIAERLSTVFIPAVCMAALGAALYWGVIAKDLERGGLSALSVLVVACPCALGLATPLAASLAIGKAARAGVLIRSGEVLERLCALRTICFDKTGTLTIGRLSVTGIDTTSGVTVEELLAHAATVEAGSEHAVAGAIIKEAQARGIGTDELIHFTAVAGHGAEGEIHRGGNTQRVTVGSLGYLLSQHRLPEMLASKDGRDLQTSI
ncbi:MAG TPA: HAD-IC family P-type ATPase, partial [Armatimonadota bacterium]|nr:HAD-IC family P-type ATPase [Armatimonadota bacterium]